MEQNDNLEKEINETVEQMSPKGSLFESIHYFNDEQLNLFLQNMNQQQSIYCLIEACPSLAFEASDIEDLGVSVLILSNFSSINLCKS